MSKDIDKLICLTLAKHDRVLAQAVQQKELPVCYNEDEHGIFYLSGYNAAIRHCSDLLRGTAEVYDNLRTVLEKGESNERHHTD